MKNLQYIFILLFTLVTASCSDDLSGVGENPGENLGQMVMFSSGTTENHILRAYANTYYMPDTYRFVCRMYYKAQTGSDKFDVSGNTDQTAWMKVSGNIGNSLYWNKLYAEVGSQKGPGGVDEYGNDYSATAFYWQNRQEHAFLAWTDLNKARDMIGGDAEGRLNFVKDMDYRIYYNENVMVPELEYYEIYGIGERFTTHEDMEAYVRTHGKQSAFIAAQSALEAEKSWTWQPNYYYYRHGKQFKYSIQHVVECNKTTTAYDHQWFQEFMYFETLPYTPDGTEGKEMSTEQGKEDIIAFLKKNDVRVAKAELKVNEDGDPVDEKGVIIDTPADYIYTYSQTDEYGNLVYNENKPEFTFYYGAHYVMKERKKYDDYPCNRFDLTRGDKTNMSEQPDIAQALTLQAPSGATQESNRVNLYFRHQFSQLQVNVKNAADNSVALESDNIKKVELLGVSEEGYVFTELDEDGDVRPAAYKEIDFSNYTEQQLIDNQFGTSFNMFPMSAEDTAPGYLKSFNCITFGQLQAIRITWKETETDIVHASTFRIPNTELVNLQSGMKYIWNIEIRRGTLAIIRTEIVDWILPTDEVHNGITDGIISD